MASGCTQRTTGARGGYSRKSVACRPPLLHLSSSSSLRFLLLLGDLSAIRIMCSVWPRGERDPRYSGAYTRWGRKRRGPGEMQMRRALLDGFLAGWIERMPGWALPIVGQRLKKMLEWKKSKVRVCFLLTNFTLPVNVIVNNKKTWSLLNWNKEKSNFKSEEYRFCYNFNNMRTWNPMG